MLPADPPALRDLERMPVGRILQAIEDWKGIVGGGRLGGQEVRVCQRFKFANEGLR